MQIILDKNALFWGEWLFYKKFPQKESPLRNDSIIAHRHTAPEPS